VTPRPLASGAPTTEAGAIRWDAPGPYAVAFTTRVGGVSDGPYASLNLGRRTGDDVVRVDENRARACGQIGGDAARLAVNRQVHGTTVRRAAAGGQGAAGDALWTNESGVPLLALSADCLPVALVRTEGEPAAAVVHAGWPGLLAGVLERTVEVLGGRVAAAIGPAAGPCCYEVGAEVAQPYRARFGEEIVRGRKLDLWSAGERALEAAGTASVHRTDLCTICNPDLFFSHRRDGLPRGVQGVLAVVT
jgi:polyphenol oxidase